MSAIGQQQTGIARRLESTPYLEDKDTRGISKTVEGELSGQLSRGLETVHSCYEGFAAEILARQLKSTGLSRSIRVRDRRIFLRFQCNRVGSVFRPAHASGRKTRHRRPWIHSKITGHHRRTSIGDPISTQHGEIGSHSKRGVGRISMCRNQEASNR